MNDNQTNGGNKPENDNDELEKAEAEAMEAEAQAPEAAAPEGDLRDAEIADLKDKLLRTVAEMENLRKRSERERQDTSQYAITGFARDLLDVADNLRRALESIPADAASANGDLKPFIEGVEMTERVLLSAFEKNGIERFSPEGERFDHNRHEAMFEAPSPDHPNGTVFQVLQPGYTIKDRLLRPAKVGVARNTEAPPKDTPRVDKTV